MQVGRLIEVIIYVKHHLGPLNGRLIEGYLVIVLQIFWDFDVWPFNGGWPINGGPLNRGCMRYLKSFL